MYLHRYALGLLLLSAALAPTPAVAASPAAVPAALAAAAPATAAGAGAGNPLVLTVVLTPADRAGLLRLAGQVRQHDSAAQAVAVAATAPSTARRDRVHAALRSAGLRVLSQTPWDLRVEGTPGVVERAFQVRLLGSGSARHPDSAPALPGLAGDVTAVLGLDDRPLLRPRSVPGYGPVPLRAAYAVNRPASTGAGTTVATVQFSGWDAGDLSSYALDVGQSLAPGQLTEVTVGAASASTPDGSGGEGEVALDQEMLLAGAPAALQRAYFGLNSDQGSYDTYSVVADEVAAKGIVALSTSWGSCEQDTDTGYEAALGDVLARTAAAGATVFAASGDSGAYDCAPPDSPQPDTSPADARLDVDVPAVLPTVIGVGGTTLTSPSGSPSERAWSESGDVLGAPGQSGGGGGESTRTARPAYQDAVAPTGTTRRIVPDIAADADPGTGVGIVVDGSTYLAGGTSAASPLMAAELAATLSSLGCATGAGDIHSVLYAHPEDFRDITTGNNLIYPATTGFDEATGLGAPLWSRLAEHLLPGGCLGAAAPKGDVIAVQGTTGHLYASRQAGAFSDLGGTVRDAPAVVSGRGRNYYVVRGSDDALYVRTDSTSFTPLVAAAGTRCGEPDAAVLGEDLLLVGCRGSDNRLYTGFVTLPLAGNPSLPRLTSQGGVLAAGPALWFSGRTAMADVVGASYTDSAGATSDTYRRTLTDRTGVFTRTGTACGAAPTTASTAGHVYSACVAPDDTVAARVDGAVVSSDGVAEGRTGLAVASDGSKATLVVQGVRNRLYRKTLMPSGATAYTAIQGLGVAGVDATLGY